MQRSIAYVSMFSFCYNQLVQRLFCPQFPPSETVPKQDIIRIETVQKEDKAIPRFFPFLYFCTRFRNQTNKKDVEQQSGRVVKK